ncbi:MAG TPA: hypothetical protein VKA85_03535 [Candidatus Limnocylindrales bacterium]|nr:hypothetical protein [Candidatus Limnocylindrales bacterium]
MHRRSLGRGRLLAIVSALVMLVGCVLPWYTVGGGEDLPARQFTAFGGSGILVFLAALATIALVALPYAAGDRPVSTDRWLAYLLFAIAAWFGLAVWLLNLVGVFAQGLAPDRAPGFWVSVVGAIALTRAAYDIAHEPGAR